MRMGGCAAAYGLATVTPAIGRERMYRIWYWATIVWHLQHSSS